MGTNKWSRNLAGVVFSALLAFVVAPPAAGVAGFGDVPDGRYFTIPVQWMVDEGITTGTSPSCFEPDATVTRGQGITFLWRFAGEPAAPSGTLDDVTAAWMREAVDWGENRGVTSGLAPGVFGPDLPFTRAQFVTMLWRYAGSPSAQEPAPFSDLSSDWYRDAVAWALERGVTVGVDDNRFAPDRPLSRGELATMLYRFASPRTPSLDPANPACGVPASSDGLVEAPRGVLGPVTSTAVDPESVGIRWDGDRYVVPGGFTWDESSDGGYLLFTKGRVVINGDGVVLSGVVFDDIYSGGNPVIKAGTRVGPFTLRHFRSVGGRGSAVVDSTPGRGDNSVVSNFEIVGFDGDGIKPMVGSTFTDGFIHLSSDPSSGKHYDGVQITGRSNVTLSRLRFRLEGENNINAAIFVQSYDGTTSNNTTITDIDVEHIPYSWYPIRLRSGSVVMHDVVGRGPTNGGQPSAFVQHKGQSGIDWGSVHVAFDGPVDLETR